MKTLKNIFILCSVAVAATACNANVSSINASETTRSDSTHKELSIKNLLDQRYSFYVEDVDGVKTLNLRELELTSLEGIFDIRGITDVENIFLMGNNLKNIEELQKLSHLKRLWLGFNNLTSLPQGLTELTNLEKLCLDNNKITSFEGLEKLTQLREKLCLHNNEITSLEFVKSLSHLQSIDIAHNPVKDFTPLIGHSALKQVYVDADQNLFLSLLPVGNLEIEVYKDMLGCPGKAKKKDKQKTRNNTTAP